MDITRETRSGKHLYAKILGFILTNKRLRGIDRKSLPNQHVFNVAGVAYELITSYGSYGFAASTRRR